MSGGRPKFLEFFRLRIFLIISLILSFVFWLIVNVFWPGFFNPFRFWNLPDDTLGALANSWPFYLYCFIITLVIRLKGIEKIHNKHVVLVRGVYKSVRSGLLEEIGYRNLFIFSAMAVISIMDFITLGFVLWLEQVFLFPIIDIVTLGLMHNIIYGFPVIFIAGSFAANAVFTYSHRYQGLYGWINSWFAGLYLLTVMLTNGLIIAILAHMIYDLIYNVVRYGGRTLKQKNS